MASGTKHRSRTVDTAELAIGLKCVVKGSGIIVHWTMAHVLECVCRGCVWLWGRWQWNVDVAMDMEVWLY